MKFLAEARHIQFRVLTQAGYYIPTSSKNLQACWLHYSSLADGEKTLLILWLSYVV